MKISVAITDTNDPKLETAFHPLNASGKSGILRGINFFYANLMLLSFLILRLG